MNHNYSQSSKTQIFRLNLHLLKLNPGLYIGYFFSQIAWASSPFVCSYLIGLFFDGLEAGAGLPHFYILNLLLLFVHVVGIYLIRKAGIIDVLIQFSVGRKIRNNIVRLMIESTTFKTDSIGPFLDVLNYDVTALQYMLLTQLDLLSQLAFLTVALIILGSMNFVITLFVIVPIVLLSYLVWHFSEKYKHQYAKTRDISISYSKFISESVMNHEALQFFRVCGRK